jgi:hypothetical protein
MKILKIRLDHLRNEAHLQFIATVREKISEYPSVASIVANLTDKFNTEIELESKLVDAARNSWYTERLYDTDQLRNRYLAGLNATINAARHHFDPVVVDAAHTIYLRLKSFPGYIEQKSYEEESTAVKILVSDLKSKYAEQVETLKLDGWISAISGAQTDFDEIFILRNKEWAARPTEKLVDVRKLVDATYRNIVGQIDAWSLLNGDDITGEFVRILNTEITYFKDHIHRRAKKDIDRATVSSIAGQVYSGEPAVPVPEVFYDGMKLVFMRDYTVSYHDNDRPGTALVIIHGKGRFTGLKRVSFNIVPPDRQSGNG